jgi:ubiquinone/menaquinone biosynthesis C-methylase UbiE
METAVHNPNQQLWEKGDFTRIAESMRQSGEQFVDSLGVQPDMAVLDVGCGDGTTAIPLARRAARVLGVDIARNLVDAGNARAREHGLDNLRFEHGCASRMDAIGDNAFDLSVSVFGAMFAPRPHDVASELVRVTSPGGRIVMGNWIPGDPTLVAQILRISAAYTPPPPEGFISPMMWGVEEQVIDRFARAGIASSQVTFSRERWSFTLPEGPKQMLARFRDYYGPTMNAFAAAEGSGKRDQLQEELDALFDAQNASGRDDHTHIPATFLRVAVQVD